MKYNENNEIYMYMRTLKLLCFGAWVKSDKNYILEVSIFVHVEIFTAHTPC
jgi:hypothetical protein